MGYERAKQDLNRFLNAEFSELITISTPSKSFSVQINALVSKHKITISPSNGLPVNSDNIHCSFIEQNLIDLEFPVRNAKNEVNLLKHIISFVDSNEILGEYVINETWPDNKLGIIVCMLARYNGV